MSEQTERDQPDDDIDDDVEGHRFLTPEQAQERAEAARHEREQRHDEAADSSASDS